MATMTMISLDALGDPLTPFRSPEVISPAVVCHRPVEQSNSASFAVLPEEIIVKILEWCDSKGVLACQLVRGALVFGPIGSDTANRTPSFPTPHPPAQTCRALKDVIANSTGLRYKLALSEYGMCDGLSNPLSKAEKLELLTAHAAAWRDLDSALPGTADLAVGWSAPMAVSGNVIVFSKEVSRPALEHGRDHERRSEAGQVRLRPPIERHMELLVLRVPSALRRVEAAHWVLSLPADANEVCIDTSQDLLIYVLYVMSHCLPHPLRRSFTARRSRFSLFGCYY